MLSLLMSLPPPKSLTDFSMEIRSQPTAPFPFPRALVLCTPEQGSFLGHGLGPTGCPEGPEPVQRFPRGFCSQPRARRCFWGENSHQVSQ